MIKSYLTFKIGAELFAANVGNIQSIIAYKKLTKVPDMPSYLLGVINLRGEVIPVVDSRIKLGLPVSEITGNTCIIIMEVKLDGKDAKVGLLVDQVSEVLEIEDTDIKPPPSLNSESKSEVIIGVFPSDDKFVMLLDTIKLTATNEILNVA